MINYHTCRWCGARCTSEIGVREHIAKSCKRASDEARHKAVLSEWDHLTKQTNGEGQ